MMLCFELSDLTKNLAVGNIVFYQDDKIILYFYIWKDRRVSSPPPDDQDLLTWSLLIIRSTHWNSEGDGLMSASQQQTNLCNGVRIRSSSATKTCLKEK